MRFCCFKILHTIFLLFFNRFNSIMQALFALQKSIVILALLLGNLSMLLFTALKIKITLKHKILNNQI